LRDATFDATGRAYFLSAPPNNQKNSTLYPLVVRSSANGVLDTAWGYKGSAVIPLGGANVFAGGTKSTALLASSSGELYVGVDEAIPGLTKIKAAVAHLRPTGVIDRTLVTGVSPGTPPLAQADPSRRSLRMAPVTSSSG
jgi:hypothetical protein